MILMQLFSRFAFLRWFNCPGELLHNSMHDNLKFGNISNYMRGYSKPTYRFRLLLSSSHEYTNPQYILLGFIFKY